MAAKAQGLNVFKITLASPLDYRYYMIGLPKASSYPCSKSPVEHQPYTVVAAGTLQLAQRLDRVYKTSGTDATVPEKYLFAEIARLGTKFPFMDAVGRAKGESSKRLAIAFGLRVIPTPSIGSFLLALVI